MSFKKELIDTLVFLSTFVLMGILIAILFTGTFLMLQYSLYLQYNEEGYNVRFSLNDGCEMELRDIDGSTSWRNCSPGDEYVIENYGVRK